MKTKTEHTPGPWRIWYDMDAKEPRQIIGMETDFICQIDEANTNDDANARLIASAPALLAALETLVKGCDKFRLPNPVHVDQARAAIANAKGEA